MDWANLAFATAFSVALYVLLFVDDARAETCRWRRWWHR